MIAVRVVQVAIHQVVHVVPVRHRRMPAVRAMNVRVVVRGAVVGDAAAGIRVRDGEPMLVVVVLVGAVQMPVVEVAGVIPVSNRYVATVRSVDVGVVFVDGVCHGQILHQCVG